MSVVDDPSTPLTPLPLRSGCLVVAAWQWNRTLLAVSLYELQIPLFVVLRFVLFTVEGRLVLGIDHLQRNVERKVGARPSIPVFSLGPAFERTESVVDCKITFVEHDLCPS